MSKRINSRQKGKRGERAFRDVLREAGYLKAHRGQQFRGGSDTEDVKCPELPDIHWEVKFCETGNPYKWLEQADRDNWSYGHDMDSLERKAVVAHKRNGERWIAILLMDDFLEIIRRSDLPVSNTNVLPHPKQITGEWLDAMGIPHDGRGKISIPNYSIKPNEHLR